MQHAASPRPIHTGEDPESLALNPATHTLYVANEVSDDVSVIDAARCNAERDCRVPAPATERGRSRGG